MTEFFMAMDPPTITYQEKKVRIMNGKPVFYEPMELKNARQKLRAYLLRNKPDQIYDGPLELVTKWCFPLSGSHRSGEYRSTKPDTDNLQKLLKDCMTSIGFWKDDALVCRELVEKFWSDIPGIYIRIMEIGS